MKINPCKCGRKPSVNRYKRGYYSIDCVTPGCNECTAYYPGINKTVDVWNKAHPIMVPITDSEPLLEFIQEVKQRHHQNNWGACYPSCIACKAKAVLDAWEAKHKEDK